MIKFFVLLFLFTSSQFAFAAGSTQEGAFVLDADKAILKSLSVNTDLTFDHVSATGFEVYGPAGTLNFLRTQRIKHLNLNTRAPSIDADYPSPEQIEAMIYDINRQYPSLTQVIEIGRSVEGRKLLVLKISDNANTDETEPEFKYISSMHGDEITGRELMISMAKEMLAQYGSNEKMTSLIDNTEIFIMASMNPDGSAKRMRGNANYADLNRDFPDFSTNDNQDTGVGREIETQAIMNFQKQRQFSLSANFHGGAEVVNYAWDTIPDKHPFYDLLVFLSLEYANRAPYIKNSTEFQNGITNGFEWYEVNGGMQDWSYYWYNDLQFTVELSQSKWPSYSQISYFYNQNKESLIEFMKYIHMGAGFKLDRAGLNGTVTVSKLVGAEKKSLGSYKFRNSEFYKILQPGEYVFDVQANGVAAATFRTTVTTQKNGYSPNYTFLAQNLSSL